MRIIDAFTFYDAIDVLKMRLRLHYPYVDAFYICESDRSYAGKPKPYNLEARWDEFAEWHDKMHYIAFSPDITGLDFSHRDLDLNFKFDSPAWILEFAQRNHLQTHLQHIDDNDVVIVSDMDELIRPQVLKVIRQYSADQDWLDARLFMSMHYYYMNCIHPRAVWKHPYVIKGAKYRTLPDPSMHRHLGGIYIQFNDAGWHFSCLGGPEVLLDKFRNTSHTEFLSSKLDDLEYIKRCLDCGVAFHIDKREASIVNCEYSYLPVSAFDPEIQWLMRQNPKFVRLNLGV